MSVLTNYKIQNILRKHDLSRWLAKWVIELGAHTIHYKQLPTMKGQVLADFIAEIPAEKEQECRKEDEPTENIPQADKPWKLYTYGASCVEGSGAGLRLISPEGDEFTYAIRLEFKSTKNEAGYEALLARLKIVTKMGAQQVHTHVDYLLVAQQINDAYDAKEPSMTLYLQQAK